MVVFYPTFLVISQEFVRCFKTSWLVENCRNVGEWVVKIIYRTDRGGKEGGALVLYQIINKKKYTCMRLILYFSRRDKLLKNVFINRLFYVID